MAERRSLPVERRHHAPRWIEITPDYRCNNRCLGCFSVDEDGSGESMAPREFAHALVRGRATGATWLWLGGGEPTIRRDLIPVVREAKRLGYDRIRIQTNGMMLAYDEFTSRLADAGATEISLSIKGATRATHDRFANTDGSFDLMVRGAANARARGLTLEADLLVYASNAQELPAMVQGFFARGVSRFRIWLLAANEASAADVSVEVPRIADVIPHLAAAMALGLSADPEFIVSLHTPTCTLPQEFRHAAFDPAAFGLLVMNPGGHSFWLDESPIEGGAYLDSCASCAARSRCGGLRTEYLHRFGGDEFVPIP